MRTPGSWGYVPPAVEEMDQILVNGIDMITIDADGKIIEFKVMIRPLKAINVVHEQMRAALEANANPS